MPNIDLRSVVLIVGAMGLLMSIVLFFLRRSLPPSIHGLGQWSAAPACFLVSMVLLALRGTISDLFSVVVGNLLLLVGCLLLLLGAQRFFGVAAKRPLWNWPVFFALATSALIWTTLIEPDYGLRLRAMTLLLFSIIFSLALLVRQKTGSTFAGRFCTLVLLLQSAVIFLRFGATFFWSSGSGLFEPNIYQALYIASFAFTMLLFTVGTVLLLNERLRVEFQTIINAAKQSESNALATKNRLQATLDAIPDLLFELGLDGKYHDYHSPHTDLIAAAPGVPLRSTVHQVLAPDAAHACMTAVQEAHQNGQSRGQQFQLQLPQGVRWFELSVARMNVERGQEPRCIVLSRDITERKLSEVALQQSLRDKDALLKEVHHRVKNNLQVVISLLRLEAGRSTHSDTKAVLQEMQGRIRSMAMLHESLYRSGTLAWIDLGAYLEQLAVQIFRTQSTQTGLVQLKLNLAAVEAGMDQAIPMGLLVNELISNCLKHGFVDGRSGEVSIELQPVDHAQAWRLRVSDTGVGLPSNFEEKRKNSLGLQLIGDLSKQVGGVLQVESSLTSGTAFTVTFTPMVTETLPADSR